MIKARPLIIAVLVFSLLASACNGTLGPTSSPTTTPSASPAPTPTTEPSPTPIQSPASPLPSFADIVEKVLPAVVYISVEYLDDSLFFPRVRAKSGSGVLLSTDGYILTNNHVVEDYRTIEVLLPDSRQSRQAEVVGTDSLSDLAVIKIEGDELRFAEFGDPSRLRVGDWVIAIGSPLADILGAESGPTVTTGIVSNLGRSFTLGESTYYDVIQTNAAINPGNSGGPLVDLEGKVVGINTFIISAAQNIGFAVGSHTAERVYEDLIEFGRVTRPYLGVTLRTLTPTLATELGLTRNLGVLAWYIAPDGPVDKAGLQVEDVITFLDDHEVSEASELIRLLWQHDVGDTVKLTCWRGEEEHEVWVTLAERPDEP